MSYTKDNRILGDLDITSSSNRVFRTLFYSVLCSWIIDQTIKQKLCFKIQTKPNSLIETIASNIGYKRKMHIETYMNHFSPSIYYDVAIG